MTPHDIKALVSALHQTMSLGGHSAVTDFVKLSALSEAPADTTVHREFESLATAASEHLYAFHQAFPLEYVKIPPQSVDDAMPEGWTFDDLAPTFEKIKQAALAGEPLEDVELPEGVSSEQMSVAWSGLRLYFDSGAVLRRTTQHNKATARLRIAENGLSDVLIVLDEAYRIVDGLPELWALSEMHEHTTVPAVILKNMPQDAGWELTSLRAEERGASLPPGLNTVREAFDSASPREREFFRDFGFTPVPAEKIELHGSRETMARLGGLIAKQLGYRTKFDPAQLLYIEALREAITATRQGELDPKGDPDEAKKLQRHLNEEAKAEAKGAQIIVKKGGWTSLGDGRFAHWAMPEYVFKVVESEAESVVAPEAESPDPRLMPLSQFQLLARTHFGLSGDEASTLYSAESDEAFNRRLKRYIAQAPEIAANSPLAPTPEEVEKRTQRLLLWGAAL